MISIVFSLTQTLELKQITAASIQVRIIFLYKMYSELSKITRLLCIVLVLHHHRILSFTFHRIIESRSLLHHCPCDSSRRRVPLFSSKYDLNNHKSFTNEKISETHSSEFYLEPIKESQIR